MITRFNVLSIAVIFVISLVFLTIFFSNDGILANKSAEKRINSIQEEVKQKESDINALRYRARSASEKGSVEGDVIYSFSDDDIFSPPTDGSEEDAADEYRGLSSFMIFLYSLLITLVWSVIIIVVVPLVKGKKKGGKKNGCDSQSYSGRY